MSRAGGDVYLVVRLVHSSRFHARPRYTHGHGHQVHWLHFCLIVYPGGRT